MCSSDLGFAEGFIQSHFRGIYSVASTPVEVMQQIDAARTRPPIVGDPSDPLGGGRG